MALQSRLENNVWKTGRARPLLGRVHSRSRPGHSFHRIKPNFCVDLIEIHILLLLIGNFDEMTGSGSKINFHSFSFSLPTSVCVEKSYIFVQSFTISTCRFVYFEEKSEEVRNFPTFYPLFFCVKLDVQRIKKWESYAPLYFFLPNK